MFEIERRVEEASAPPFLTKVVAPRVAAERTLRRERLLERLHAQLAPGQRVTQVTAPAGYGKTTLLAQFAAEVDALTAWCTLDEHDRDAATLLGYLVAAVAGRVPGFGWRTRGALMALAAAGEGANGGGRGAGETQQLRAAVGTFVTELQALDDFLLLVVDDCHVLLGEPSAAAVLDLLIEHLPEHCHVVLAGRTLPEIPCLAALTARRQAWGLDVWQLRLTPEETGALVERAGIGKLSDAAAESLHGEAQGWPMAALLLAPHVVGSGENGTGSAARDAGGSGPTGAQRRLPRRARRELFAFLAAEVLGQQPVAVQNFLLRTSVLAHVEVGRCAALLGRPADEVRRLLAACEERGLFLTQLEDETYRFHDLFRELLLETLREQQAVRHRWLQRRAAQLAERAGEAPQAIEHALAGAHYGRAARLVEEVGTSYVASGRWNALRRWLGALPDEVMDARPQVLLIAARVERVVSGNAERADALVRRAARAAVANKLLCAEVALARARILDWRGRYLEAADACGEALAALGNDAPLSLRGSALFWRGLSFSRLGRLAEARSAYSEASSLSEAAGDAPATAVARDGIASVLLQEGNLPGAVSELRQTLAIWRQLENAQGQARTLNNLGVASHHAGDYPEAKSFLLEAANVAHDAGWPEIEACAWLSLGDVERDRGEIDAAYGAYCLGSALAAECGNRYLARYATDALGQTKRIRGDLANAELAARQVVHEAQVAGSRHEHGMYLRSLGLVHLARGEWEQAQASLDSSHQLLTACGARRELARTCLLRAQLAQAARRPARALKELAALGNLLGELGYHGFLLGDARRVMPLLEHAIEKKVGGARLVALLEDALRAQKTETAESDAESTEEWAPAKATETRGELSLPALEAFALGQSEVRVDGRTISGAEWRRQKGKELFFYLLCHPGWQGREQIEADVWPEASKERARSSFHTNAHYLRRSLHPDVLEVQEGRYRLNPRLRCWLDADEFERLCRTDGTGTTGTTGATGTTNTTSDAGRAQQSKRARLREAIALYRGPFLQDLSPEWAEERRRRHETTYVEALVELGHERVRHGAYDAAVRLAERALEIDPYLDAAHEVVMLARMAAGQEAAALHHYTRHAERLRREMNEAPAPALQALRQQLVARVPAAALAG